MAWTFYKARGIGKDPICVICGGPGGGPREKHHLTRGLYVWLCPDHRSDDFQRSRAGRDFVVSLMTVWQAAGPLTKRQSGALDDHMRRVRQPKPQRDRRGSYAWPKLREEAERRFAAGEDPNTVIPDLQDRYEGLPINAPTERTMRRWFTDGRWLAAAPGKAASTEVAEAETASHTDESRTPSAAGTSSNVEPPADPHVRGESPYRPP